MIDPKEIELDGIIYVISKFPAIEGREIICNYMATLTQKVVDYKTNEEMMLKALSFIAVKKNENSFLQLSSKQVVNGNVKSWETLLKLESLIMEYNCSFLPEGSLSNLLINSSQKLQELISKMSMDSSGLSSQKEKQL